jgi:rhodanese-related sulfurtransferase
MICINCNDKSRASGNSVTVLDLKNVNEFHKGRSPDAKNVPLEDLPILAQQYSDKDEPVVIYCGAYSRTIIAEKILRAMGFTDITNINSANQNRYCH